MLETLRYAVARVLSDQQGDDFLSCLDMVRNASVHRRRHADRLVDAAEVLTHEIERYGGGMVLHLLAERIRQARESPHGHAHSPQVGLMTAT